MRPHSQHDLAVTQTMLRNSNKNLFTKCKNFGKILGASMFEYETQKVVSISSLKIGLIYRFIQLNILLYVIFYVMIYQKQYQVFDNVVSGVTTKLKGLDFTNITGVPGLDERLWDSADYAVPPVMNSAFFVITNAIITVNQQQGRCDEHPEYKWHAAVRTAVTGCKVDANCKRGEIKNVGSGIKTGRCVNSSVTAGMRMCEVHAWCPVEHDVLISKNKPLLQKAKNFTVMIKNSIEFPYFKVKRRNVLPWMTSKFLRDCNFRPDDERLKYCPIFKLDDIIRYRANEDNKKMNDSLWINGGMVAIDINWDCNLDYDEKFCLPRYSFRHLDDGALAQGNNFRYAHYYRENGVLKRTLIKAFGIQFFISVTGRGGRFSIVAFSMNLGSGVALLGLATVLCDTIVLNIMRKRKKYRNAKVDKVRAKRESELSEDLIDNREFVNQTSRLADNDNRSQRSPIKSIYCTNMLIESETKNGGNLLLTEMLNDDNEENCANIELVITNQNESKISFDQWPHQNSYVGKSKVEKMLSIHF